MRGQLKFPLDCAKFLVPELLCQMGNEDEILRVRFKLSALSWINKLSKDVVQGGLKGSAESSLFGAINNTATKKQYLIRKQCRLREINRDC